MALVAIAAVEPYADAVAAACVEICEADEVVVVVVVVAVDFVVLGAVVFPRTLHLVPL